MSTMEKAEMRTEEEAVIRRAADILSERDAADLSPAETQIIDTVMDRAYQRIKRRRASDGE